uniref:Uncharacterized protein n=1 Tax=Salmo trutta TaxID=8032 RepID=A0A673ZFU2_SALTR
KNWNYETITCKTHELHLSLLCSETYIVKYRDWARQPAEEGCIYLASALRYNPSHLKELDLSYNHPGDSGVKRLSAVLEDPHSMLKKLRVDHGGECRAEKIRCRSAQSGPKQSAPTPVTLKGEPRGDAKRREPATS